MQKTFHLVISSVGETYFDGQAVSATLPGSDGELTVLPNHEPFVTALKNGTITVRLPAGETKTFKTENGILEFSGNRAVVLL
ncbi:MAG: F0F1 ATP synthase subunit epsilon [Candidatus Kaiserbacteria bacterium]|nr:F0F1 ATP synthase subunit epsilon [Candidatus Kaiserbacteria bacterium]